MGSMTRLGQGITPLESNVKSLHIRISRNGVHGFRTPPHLYRFGRQKCKSIVPIQIEPNNDGILKPEIQWCGIKPRRSLGCRASSADAGTGDLHGNIGNDFRSEVGIVKEEATNGGPKGMAEAFDISPRTALGITAVIAISVLVLPMYMPSSGVGMTLRTRGDRKSVV